LLSIRLGVDTFLTGDRQSPVSRVLVLADRPPGLPVTLPVLLADVLVGVVLSRLSISDLTLLSPRDNFLTELLADMRDAGLVDTDLVPGG